MGSVCTGCGKTNYSMQDIRGKLSSPGSPVKLLTTGASQPSTKNQAEIAVKKCKRMKALKAKRKIKQIEGSIEAANAEITDKIKTDEDLRIIMGSLNNHFILRSLDEDSRLIIANDMRYYTIGPKEVIFEQGQPGLCFFVLTSGRLEVFVNGVRKNLIHPGTGFGEYALLDERPRTATITTYEKSTL